MSLAIALLDSLLDNKLEMKERDKTTLRNCLIPMVELVESSTSPKEVIDNIILLVSIFSVPVAISLDIALKPDAHNRILLSMTDNLYKSTQELLSLLRTMKEINHQID